MYGGFKDRMEFLEGFYRLYCDCKATIPGYGSEIADAMAAEYLTAKYGEHWKKW